MEWFVWGGLALTVAAIVVAFALSRYQRPASQTDKDLPIYGSVSPFALTNQMGTVVSRESLKGRVWLANIIFTRCPGPCAEISRAMAEIAGQVKGGSDVHFVSLTADPGFDTPAVLRRYAGTYGADPARWSFLTGPKLEIYDLATDGLKLAVKEKTEGERTNVDDLFIHSTMFTLVDREGRLRGFFEGLEPADREEAVQAIQKLIPQDAYVGQ